MRHSLFAICMLLIFDLTGAASAQAQTTVQTVITTADPATYSQQLADRMAAEGVSALRPVLTQLYASQVRVPVASVQLPPQYDAQFATAQSLIAGRRASLARKVGDVVMADTLRSIFYYHYYGDNVWIFSRFDFVRVAGDRWAVSLVLWGGDQSVVGISPSPSQHSIGAASP